MSFAEQDGSFLAGAAAALKSRTGVIGFIGASDFARVQKFHAGYEAGARAIDPDIRVRASYLSQPLFIGTQSFTPARRAADRLYSGGADVIYHAAGWSRAATAKLSTRPVDNRSSASRAQPTDPGFDWRSPAAGAAGAAALIALVSLGAPALNTRRRPRTAR